jgi:hypothetical protein
MIVAEAAGCGAAERDYKPGRTPELELGLISAHAAIVNII